MAAGPRLGIDFGTSHTVALLAWPDGRVRPLLFDGSPLLPSSVYAQTDGAVLVGRDAVHAARVDPSRFEASPKRRIDDGTVLLGDREVTVPALIGAVLSHVAQEAVRVAGGPISSVTLTHPAAWGVSRRLALIEGTKLAGLPEPTLMPEPVAAAHYFAGVLRKPLAADQGLLVYDFGGGTFDASIVTRSGDGFDVRAVDGIDDLGGLDLDALIVDHAKLQLADPEVWARLESPQTTEDRRHRRLLWDDARIAKEMLSRTAATGLHVPIAAADVNITREAFEEKARPKLEQTVRTTAAVVRWAGLDKGRLAGLFLVGGSSRIPLVATLLERELGLAPTIIEQPEMVVAEGSLRAWVGVNQGQQGQQNQAQPVSGAPGYGPGMAAAAAAQGAAQASTTPPGGYPPGNFPQSAPPAPNYAQGGQAPGTPPQGFQPGPQGFQQAPPVSGAPAGYPQQPYQPQPGYQQGQPQPGQPGQPYQNPQGQPGYPAPPAYPAPPGYQGQPSQGYQQGGYPQTPPGGAAPVSGVPMSGMPMSSPPVSSMPVSPVAYPVSGMPSSGAGAEATQPVRASAPFYQSPAATPTTYAPPPREDPLPPARRRSVAIPLLVGVLVLALALAGYVVLRDRDKLKDTAGTGGNPTTSATAQGNGANASASAAATSAAPKPSHSPHVIPTYAREKKPWWVPKEWADQNLGSIDSLWNTADETEGGRCEATAQKLHVTSQPRSLTGCTLKAPLNKAMYDGAIETKIHVTKGCAGVWLRTGDRGYTLGYCADGYVRIYKLGDAAPGDGNTLEEWTYKASYDPYVGFKVQGTELIFFIGGMQFGPVSDQSDPINSGKINLGAFSSTDDGANVDFSEVRVFLPTAA